MFGTHVRSHSKLKMSMRLYDEHTHTLLTIENFTNVDENFPESAFKFSRIDLRLTVCCQRIHNYTFME